MMFLNPKSILEAYLWSVFDFSTEDKIDYEPEGIVNREDAKIRQYWTLESQIELPAFILLDWRSNCIELDRVVQRGQSIEYQTEIEMLCLIAQSRRLFGNQIIDIIEKAKVDSYVILGHPLSQNNWKKEHSKCNHIMTLKKNGFYVNVSFQTQRWDCTFIAETLVQILPWPWDNNEYSNIVTSHYAKQDFPQQRQFEILPEFNYLDRETQDSKTLDEWMSSFRRDETEQ